MKIAAMTVACVDLYLQQGMQCVGGNSLNFLTQCRKEEVEETAIIACVGTDDMGLKVREHLESRAIDTSHLYFRDGKTASNKIYITDEGERTFLPDSWDGGVYQDFSLSEADWAFLGQYDILAIPANNLNFFEALKRKAADQRLVVDFLDSRDYSLIERSLPFMDIGFISGDWEMIEKLKPVSRKVDTMVVVTLGSEGSVTLLRGETYFQGAIPVRQVVDTTGCGDSYQAAFTVSWFQHRDIRVAMMRGAIAASYVLQHFGGV